jgi:regulator of cell morphogenesis and NO signaling
MMDYRIFTPKDRMEQLITTNYRLLNMLSRFGISLGVADRSIEEVCRLNGVDCSTFLAVVNLFNNPDNPQEDVEFSTEELISYLQKSHTYYIDYRLPAIRAELEKATQSGGKQMQYLILNYFDDYAAEVARHMNQENEEVFPYVQKLLVAYRNGENLSGGKNPHIFSEQHNSIDVRLGELIDIIVKYYPGGATNELNTVLYDIFVCQQDLESHNLIEDVLLVPQVKKMEEALQKKSEKRVEDDTLSERERDVLVHIVRGLTNKEIAAKMFLSVHTVNTHRKNIMNKLKIHSPAGLTIYAIVNKLVEIEDLDIQ